MDGPSRILFLAAALFARPSIAIAADPPPESQVQHAVAAISKSDDPDVVTIYQLSFDLRLTNRSETTINVPVSTAGPAELVTYEVHGVQSQQADGSWKYLIQSSFYGTETTKYADCSSIAPGATAEIKDLSNALVLLKRRAQELGKEATLRLDIWFFCRKPDGTVPYNSTTTAPFHVHLPYSDK